MTTRSRSPFCLSRFVVAIVRPCLEMGIWDNWKYDGRRGECLVGFTRTGNGMRSDMAVVEREEERLKCILTQCCREIHHFTCRHPHIICIGTSARDHEGTRRRSQPDDMSAKDGLQLIPSGRNRLSRVRIAVTAKAHTVCFSGGEYHEPSDR